MTLWKHQGGPNHHHRKRSGLLSGRKWPMLKTVLLCACGWCSLGALGNRRLCGTGRGEMGERKMLEQEAFEGKYCRLWLRVVLIVNLNLYGQEKKSLLEMRKPRSSKMISQEASQWNLTFLFFRQIFQSSYILTSLSWRVKHSYATCHLTRRSDFKFLITHPFQKFWLFIKLNHPPGQVIYL